jgi:Zn-dependent protease/predicted transcriptional regulator
MATTSELLPPIRVWTPPSAERPRPLTHRWALKLGRIAGIDVYVHATFGLLLAWVGLGELFAAGRPTMQVVMSSLLHVLFVMAVFATIVLHELGHALTAKHFGVRTRDITLYPIGGIARLDRIPSRPFHELCVALAGPMVNLAIGLCLFAALDFRHVWPAWPEVLPGSMIASFAATNVFIALFNLLPAFPMDGGRALRALLALRWGTVTATRAAAAVGQGMAAVFALVGFFVNPMLLLVAVFVWLGARQELGATMLRARLEGITVADAMSERVPRIAPDDPLVLAPGLSATSRGLDLAVMEGERLVGWLRFDRMVKALTDGGAAAPVRSAMETSFPSAAPHEALADVLDRFAEHRAIPVLEGGRLMGVVAAEAVARLASSP